MPYFSLAFFIIAINVVLIGYLQSIEAARLATLFTLLRGFIFSLPTFIFLPRFIGAPGLWLALPFAEGATSAVMFLYSLVVHFKKKK